MSIWRNIQKQNFTKINTILDYLELDDANKLKILKNSPFIFNLPLRLAKKIKKNCLEDPIFKQFIPLTCENIPNPDFVNDPVSDQSFCRSARLLQKYKHRALLLCSSACAMHCRYCFRQNFPYERKSSTFDEEIDLIKNDTSIKEVILSGGDPLSLSNLAIKNLMTKLDKIEHLKRIRFHTRFVIGIPERIDELLLETFQNVTKQIYFVIHVNHPIELDKDVISYLKKIQKLQIPILSQTVLLKGVNDNLNILKDLCEILVDNGIIPYYLHDLDPVKGASHFKVAKERGIELVQKLREEISGYGVFQYVSEIPFKKSKMPII
jgi:EF-P beta-lysylation protein EpmB